MTHDNIFGSVVTSVLTATAIIVPDSFLDFGGKLLSVFVLAAAAEVGRRLIGKLWKPKL